MGLYRWKKYGEKLREVLFFIGCVIFFILCVLGFVLYLNWLEKN
jgi:hypothetical protein